MVLAASTRRRFAAPVLFEAARAGISLIAARNMETEIRGLDLPKKRA